MKVRPLILAALFAAVLSALARLAIPIPFSPVPVTGQMCGVFLAGAVLGSRLGSFSVLVYVLLGAFGLPVFAQGRAGPGVLLGPSGGYLAGFVLGTYASGRVLERRERPGYLTTAAAMALCLLVTYGAGVTQLALVLHLPPAKALGAGVLPFLPLDLAKIAIAAGVAVPVRRSLEAAHLLPTRSSGRR
ncbi:MAG: biotin transporter BioY [Bacillota bacterium]